MRAKSVVWVAVVFASTLFFAPAASAGSPWNPIAQIIAFFRGMADGIADNADGVAANAGGIADNADNIASNKGHIENLADDIDALSAALDALYDAQPVTGSVDFDYEFTGSNCQEVVFASPFEARPTVYAAVNHYRRTSDLELVHDPDARHDTVTTWFEEVSETGFRVCVREVARESGRSARHDHHVTVDWLAQP